MAHTPNTGSTRGLASEGTVCIRAVGFTMGKHSQVSQLAFWASWFGVRVTYADRLNEYEGPGFWVYGLLE
eukprot:1240090-Rhodomonas_salina.2